MLANKGNFKGNYRKGFRFKIMNDETSQLLSDTAEKLFSDHVTKNCIIDAEKGTWPDELWSEVIANGLNLILVPEELGGVGGNWMNAGILFKASGRYQAPIPLAENIVASYILSLAGISQPLFYFQELYKYN